MRRKEAPFLVPNVFRHYNKLLTQAVFNSINIKEKGGIKMSAEERMIINAAIERLITQEDSDGTAAKLVVEYGSKLPKSKNFTFEANIRGDQNDSFSGHVQGHGNLSVKETQKDSKKEYNFGVYKDRVGYYRLWKNGEGALTLHHFWKSSISTQTDEDGPDHFMLFYNPRTLEPLCFAHKRTRILFSFSLGLTIKFGEHYLEPINGSLKRIKVKRNPKFFIINN